MSSDRTVVYSADRQQASFAGVDLFSGTADGEFCTIELEADDFTKKVGSDGEVGVARSNNRSGTVKVKLLQTSAVNGDLTSIRNTGLESPNGGFVGVFQVRDLNTGRVLFKANKAWIQKPPGPNLGREILDREWTFGFAKGDLDLTPPPAV